MNKELELNLWNSIKNNSLRATHAMVTGHMGLVYRLAHNLKPPQKNGDCLEELISEGYVALCESVDQFLDRNPDCNFSTFSYRRIRAKMISYLRTEGTVVKTEWESRVTKRSRDHCQYLFMELGREPTEEEVAFLYGQPEAERMIHGTRPADIADWDVEIEASNQRKPIDRAIAEERCYDGLTSKQKIVLKAMSNGATVGAVAQEWKVDREGLIRDLWEVHTTFLEEV